MDALGRLVLVAKIWRAVALNREMDATPFDGDQWQYTTSLCEAWEALPKWAREIMEGAGASPLNPQSLEAALEDQIGMAVLMASEVPVKEKAQRFKELLPHLCELAATARVSAREGSTGWTDQPFYRRVWNWRTNRAIEPGGVIRVLQGQTMAEGMTDQRNQLREMRKRQEGGNRFAHSSAHLS